MVKILGQILGQNTKILGQILGMESHARDLGMNSHSFLLFLHWIKVL